MTRYDQLMAAVRLEMMSTGNVGERNAAILCVYVLLTQEAVSTVLSGPRVKLHWSATVRYSIHILCHCKERVDGLILRDVSRDALC